MDSMEESAYFTDSEATLVITDHDHDSDFISDLSVWGWDDDDIWLQNAINAEMYEIPEVYIADDYDDEQQQQNFETIEHVDGSRNVQLSEFDSGDEGDDEWSDIEDMEEFIGEEAFLEEFRDGNI